MFFHSAAYKDCKKQLQSIGNNEREYADRQDLQKTVTSACRTVHCFEPQGADEIAAGRAGYVADTAPETRKDRQSCHPHQDLDHNRQGPELSTEQKKCAEHGESLHGERDGKGNSDPGAMHITTAMIAV